MSWGHLSNEQRREFGMRGAIVKRDRYKAKRRERFYSKVGIAGADDCWLWRGKVFAMSGYGEFCWDGRATGTHRVAWMLEHGSIADGLFVLHHCDVRRCVNLKHLYLGTQKDNARDAVDRNRINPPRGEGHYLAKLTEADVRDVRRRSSSEIGEAIAASLGVSGTTVRDILRGRTWKSVA